MGGNGEDCDNVLDNDNEGNWYDNEGGYYIKFVCYWNKHPQEEIKDDKAPANCKIKAVYKEAPASKP